jgi:hypothetical protein
MLLCAIGAFLGTPCGALPSVGLGGSGTTEPVAVA